MDNEYNLSRGEVLIMHSEGVQLICGKERETLNEVALTNKNLILVNEVSTGLFSSQRYLKRCPLDSIVCSDGVPQAFLGKKKDTYVLQVVFEEEAVTLRFPNNEKREARRWSNAIKCAIVGDLDSIDTDETPLPSEVGDAIDGFSGLIGALAGEAAAVSKSVTKAAKPAKVKVKPKASTKCVGCHSPLTGAPGSTVTCDYCGTKQTL